MCFNSACTNQLYKQSRNMCVKCHMDRELPYGRKDFLRYIIRIPLLHILVNSLLCSANTTAKEVIFMNFSSVDVIWTLSAALAGLIYGLFFYDCNIKISKKKVTGEKRSLLEIIDFKFLIRVVLALTIDTLLVNVLLGTYWCSIMYGKGFMFYLTMRFTKNLIQLPINIFLTYNVIGIVKVINNKIYKNE